MKKIFNKKIQQKDFCKKEFAEKKFCHKIFLTKIDFSQKKICQKKFAKKNLRSKYLLPKKIFTKRNLAEKIFFFNFFCAERAILGWNTNITLEVEIWHLGSIHKNINHAVFWMVQFGGFLVLFGWLSLPYPYYCLGRKLNLHET